MGRRGENREEGREWGGRERRGGRLRWGEMGKGRGWDRKGEDEKQKRIEEGVKGESRGFGMFVCGCVIHYVYACVSGWVGGWVKGGEGRGMRKGGRSE